MKKISLLLLLFIASVTKQSFGQLTVLHSFVGNPDGSAPWGDLLSDGTFLYGMTNIGGINDSGTIFKIKPDGSGYIKLFDFAGATNGSVPQGSFVSDGTFIYGMTTYGGINSEGILFK